MAWLRSNEQFEKLNPDQRQSLDWTRSISIRANAGSGKTSVLIQRLVQILHDDCVRNGSQLHLHQIVAITFTRKAAAQMRDKFRKALVESEQQSTGHEKEYWQDRLDELPDCPIGTIDALVHRLLRAAIAEGMIADLDPAFGVLQGIDRDELIDQALVRTEQSIETADEPARHPWLNWLTTQGRWELMGALRALLNGSCGPADCRRALAAARERLGELPSMLALPALTTPLEELDRNPEGFRAGLSEVLREIDGLPPKDRGLQTVQKVRDAIAALSTESNAPGVAILTDLRAALMTKEGKSKTQGLAVKGVPKCPKLHELQQHWQPLLADWDFAPVADNPELIGQLIELFAIAHKHFRDLCQDENQFDFDYLAGRAIELLGRDEARRLTTHIRFILVDEFQDTNDLHWNLIARLAGEDPAKPVESAKLMIVGDPQQSIYRFRKADPTVFDRVQWLIRQGNIDARRHELPTVHDRHLDEIRSTDDERAGLMRLRKNYRTSHEQPLKWIDKLSMQAFGEVGFNYQPLEPGLDRSSENAECVYILPQSTDEEAKAEIATGDDASAEIIDPEQTELVAEELCRQHAQRGFAWNEMAVLLRSRNTLLTNLEETFRKFSIPFQVVGGIGFWQRQEVRDMVMLARCLANAADEMALFAVLRGPLAGLDDSELLFLSTLGSDRLLQGLRLLVLLNDTLTGRTEIEDADREWVEREFAQADLPIEILRESFAKLGPERRAIMWTAARRLGLSGVWRQRVDRMPHADLLRRALDESEAWLVYAAEPEGDRRIANLRLLLDEVRQLEASRPASLADTARRLTRLVDEADREEQAEVATPDGDAVQIMTVHAAKGLEFPVVVVVGLERQFRSDSSPVYLLDRHQHLRAAGVDPELGARLQALPVISFRDPEMPLLKVKPLLHQALTTIEREQSRTEEARIFHVALTRAMSVLILAGAARWPDGRCWQSWVHAAIELPDDFAGDQWLPPSGEMPPMRIVRAAKGAANVAPGARPERREHDLTPIHESPRTRTIAATALFRMLNDFEIDPDAWRMRYLHQVRADVSGLPQYLIQGVAPQANHDAGALVGTLVHRALELKDILPSHPTQRRNWLHAWALGLAGAGDQEEPDTESNAISLRQLAGNLADTAAGIVDRILSFAGGSFAALIKAGGSPEVDFVLAIGGWRITGRFDRMNNAATGMPEIVDWKTDSEPIEQIENAYRQQMMLYALALLESRPGPNQADSVTVQLAMTAHEHVHTFRFARTELSEFRQNLARRLAALEPDGRAD